MSNRAGRKGAALSLMIVSTLVLGGLFALMVTSPVAQAACDQGLDTITGDWTITTAQVCSGITYSVDGSININAGGSLELINGGLRFTKDTGTPSHALNVNGGGTLILDNSRVTTDLNQINPIATLDFTVTGGTVVMRNGASLKFPGQFTASGATLNFTDSTITGFEDSELVGSGLDTDANNDAPVLSWATTTASLYRSRIERLYEYPSGAAHISLTASSRLYAYDSYIGVDYSNDSGRHNALRTDASSFAYLYGVTIDRGQEDPSSKSAWQPAFQPTAAGSSIYLLRWARVIALDRTGFPVSGATITATSSPSTSPARYPDNSWSVVPNSRTLWFLGRTPGAPNNWDRTNSNGEARIPLYTDNVTFASLPNAESFGNYEIDATFTPSTTSGGVTFPAYPAITAANNTRTVTLIFSDLTVRSGPDLELTQSDYPGTLSRIQNQPFTVNALIRNPGQTPASNFAVAVYLDGNRANELARVNGLSLGIGLLLNQTLNVPGQAISGSHTLMLVADADNTINEGSSGETNNFANITVFFNPPPSGFVAIDQPDSNTVVTPGTSLAVTGFVRDPDSAGISGIVLNIELRNSAGTVVASSQATSSTSQGFFAATLDVPSTAADGSYTLSVTPTASTITPETRPILMKTNASIFNTVVPILGLPLWLFLIILAAAAAAVIGVTLYWKVYGLGKMVECGECGAFIPEDATTCPKCGVEFEKDMAKCSNCQAWIPVDVKQCPECGVEFASGEVEMADYQEKMRLQYDEVVAKFKDESSRQLGRSLSDREFQEWWRKQPTFLTFEDWLREEEDMRKMGSKPCPTCGTLNSVTATVCHKCGSLMRETPRPPGGGGGASGATPVVTRGKAPGSSPGDAASGAQASPYAPPGGTAAAPGSMEAIPRRVIRKPIAPQPVVQKKVIKKPTGEGGEGEGQSDSGQGTSDDEL